MHGAILSSPSIGHENNGQIASHGNESNQITALQELTELTMVPHALQLLGTLKASNRLWQLRERVFSSAFCEDDTLMDSLRLASSSVTASHVHELGHNALRLSSFTRQSSLLQVTAFHRSLGLLLRSVS